jgi:hypothetical protein
MLVLCAQLFDVASAAEVTLEVRGCDCAPQGLRCATDCIVTARLCIRSCNACIALQATEHEAVLLRTGSEPATVLLRLALPERCTPAAAAAKWDKRARRLTVRLPCAPALV